MQEKGENIPHGINPADSRICILIRHGESQTNVSFTYSTDEYRYPLTPYGVESVENSGKRLADVENIGKLYTSPVLRAKETAEIISRYVNIKPVIEPLLTERGFGKYNNMKFDSRESMQKIKKEQMANNYDEWENWSGIVGRAGRFISSLKKGSVTVAISHMDFIKAAIAHMTGKDESGMAGIYIENASFTVIDPDGNPGERILAIGSDALPENIIWRTS